jgi:hypothetical protein
MALGTIPLSDFDTIDAWIIKFINYINPRPGLGVYTSGLWVLGRSGPDSKNLPFSSLVYALAGLSTLTDPSWLFYPLCPFYLSVSLLAFLSVWIDGDFWTFARYYALDVPHIGWLRVASGFLLVRCCLVYFFACLVVIVTVIVTVRVTGAEGLGRIGTGVEALFLSACLKKKVRLSFLWFVVFSPLLCIYWRPSLAGHRCVCDTAMAVIELNSLCFFDYFSL